MMHIDRVLIKNFKRIEGVDFGMGDVNVLIGGNNSGKTTIIQAIHFAFTLIQSLSISQKWPAATKKSTTVSPSELVYIPSEDPYSLGYGGKLLEDPDKSIQLSFYFSDGEEVNINVRRGRITNIIVEPDNVPYAKSLSSLENPFSIYSPGLAGVSRSESYVSDGVLLRALARGDANAFLRNIIHRLKKKEEWLAFSEDLSSIFPEASLDVEFNESVDQFIDVQVQESSRIVPLDLAGTGLLQCVQILSYFHLFGPKIIILDEPDSHLHPNNQRILCSLLASLAEERSVQVLMTTHSRHVLDALYQKSKLLWVAKGDVKEAAILDQVDILLELGALDIREKISQGQYKFIILTEDRIPDFLKILLGNCGFKADEFTIYPYSGVTTINLLRPLVQQIRDISQALIVVHRDRDFLEPDEVEQWKRDIRALGAQPFVTAYTDVEGYFTERDYLEEFGKNIDGFDADAILDEIVQGEQDNIIASYVNGRLDIERKAGNFGRLDIGALTATAARKCNEDPIGYMKGKEKLKKIRRVVADRFGLRFGPIPGARIPVDEELRAIGRRG